MTSNNLYTTKSLEKQITNRKTDVNNKKVQWLNYKKEQPFNFNYKYSNNPDCPFYCNYIDKRNCIDLDHRVKFIYFISK